MKKLVSLFLLLAAAPLAFAQAPTLEKISPPGAPSALGSSAAYTVHSSVLAQTRRINVATPASFSHSAQDRRYPVIIVFDGEYQFDSKVAAAQYLAAQGQIPEAIIVGIENIGGDDERVHDLTPPGLSVSGSSQQEGGDRFLDFVEKELLPALDLQFRTGQPQVLIGHSSGAVLATYAAATRSRSFPFVLAIDTPALLQDGWLTTQLIESAKKPSARNLRYVSIEARFGWNDSTWQAFQSVAPPSWKIYREKLEHESHNSMGFLATYLGLRELFSDYSILGVPDSPTSAAIEHYHKLAGGYGTTPVPPQSLLTRVAEDFVMEGRAADAKAALDLLITSYGDYPGAAMLRANIAEAAKLPPLTETVDDLLNAPKPDQKSIAPFLGIWKGSIQYEKSPRRPVELRLEIRNGDVSGTWISWPEPKTELDNSLQYIKIVEGGLNFGYMNGMRPHGMLMHEALVHDGKLEGEMHFRGIRFTFPNGMPEPHIHFILERSKSSGQP